jgi:hypothetical protein
MTRRALTIAAAVLALAGAQPALGTYLVSRNPTHAQLQVDATGHALATYTEAGKVKRVLLWGAINALPPRAGGRQVEFRVDYSGGWKALGKPNYYRTIKNVCSRARYDGPALPYLVYACKAPDGSYWALQSWQRMLPNLGFAPWRPEQSAQELHVSHWSGPLPELKAVVNWAWGGRYQQVVGTYAYAGQPVYGFKATVAGAPLDAWGRNVYLDTLDSTYGAGWKRENAFLAQAPSGRYCYALGPRSPYPGYPASGPRQGTGARYRLSALGPGVTPIVSVELASPGDYDPNDAAKVQAEQTGNALVQRLGFASSQCHA